MLTLHIASGVIDVTGVYTTLPLGRYELRIDLTGIGAVAAFDNVGAANCIGKF